MPTIYQEVDAEFDIDVEDFIDECSDREIEKLIKYLIEEGKLPKTLTKYAQSQNLSVNDVLWYETISKIQSNRLAMTDEEIEIIEKIAKRF
jgi:predicted nucleic acid-binding protein